MKDDTARPKLLSLRTKSFQFCVTTLFVSYAWSSSVKRETCLSPTRSNVHADDAFFTVEAFLPSLTVSHRRHRSASKIWLYVSLLLLASFVLLTHGPHRARTLIPPDLFDCGESETDSLTPAQLTRVCRLYVSQRRAKRIGERLNPGCAGRPGHVPIDRSPPIEGKPEKRAAPGGHLNPVGN